MHMDSREFSCFQVSKTADGELTHAIKSVSTADLPQGDLLIRVEWSSLNYKDALAAEGHPGVAGKLPHVPGIDAAGIVEQSADSRYQPGDKVLVTGYELGAPAWGGWSELIRVPGDWAVPLPASMSTRDAMVIGTAGFTAALCVRELITNGVKPESGPVLVTGATGGVGAFAVRLLSQLGYEVHAVSGKRELTDRLKQLGAIEVHPRDLLADDPKRPLLSAKWAGGVDTVGGEMLVAFLKSTKINGCVAACGLVAGDKLPTTIYPFILRGITLAGVTSSSCPRDVREWIWHQLDQHWDLKLPENWVRDVNLADVAAAIHEIKQGKIVGRVAVKVG